MEKTAIECSLEAAVISKESMLMWECGKYSFAMWASELTTRQQIDFIKKVEKSPHKYKPLLTS